MSEGRDERVTVKVDDWTPSSARLTLSGQPRVIPPSGVCPVCGGVVQVTGELIHVRFSDDEVTLYHPACWPDIAKDPPA